MAVSNKSIENHGQKYMLLAEELYKNLKRSNATSEQLQSAEFAKVKNLDEKIEGILANPNLPDSMKARMYSEAAAEYFDLRQRTPETAAAMREHFTPLLPSERKPHIIKTPPEVPVQQPEQFLSSVQEWEKTHSSFSPIVQEQVLQSREKENGSQFDTEQKHVWERTHSLSEKQSVPKAVRKTHSLKNDDDSTKNRLGPEQMPQAVASAVTPTTSTISSIDVKEIFAQMAPTNKAQQDRMNKIYEAMKGNEKILTYDPNTYEIILHGNQRVPGSNLFSVLHHITGFKPVANKEPKGADFFLTAMGMANMSPDLISSTKLKPFVEGARPPTGQVGTGRTDMKERNVLLNWIKLF